VIRVVAVISLLCLLVLVLYLPSVHPAQRFLAQLRAEHEAMTAFWGVAPASRILSRALSLQDSAREVTPVPSASDAPPANALDSAVTQEMTSLNQRLFDNAYFRSIDALVLLASYRLSTLLEWLPWLAAFCMAALVDGGVVRLTKSREFRHHDPEVFAVFSCLAIVAGCAAVIGFVIPVTLHPLSMPAVPLLMSLLLGRAFANFHRRA
jgi:Domain of unknown function (DUF4400)